ncbi:hypothetical protein [Alteribacillus iranensis]|uniref:hypothetical protein n=1 Tax=Alteribacillus iranensis TaxID=930128 RepID=UPI000B87468D|nr:hypothetical protein [Alteribacillus iranensis]
MKKKWMGIAMSAIVSASVLAACNGGGNGGGEGEPQEQPEDVNYVPTERRDVEEDAFDQRNQDNQNVPDMFDMEGGPEEVRPEMQAR